MDWEFYFLEGGKDSQMEHERTQKVVLSWVDIRTDLNLYGKVDSLRNWVKKPM